MQSISYIQSQKHEGWIAVADRYEDGGFSGGTMERPALKRLLADAMLDNTALKDLLSKKW